LGIDSLAVTISSGVVKPAPPAGIAARLCGAEGPRACIAASWLMKALSYDCSFLMGAFAFGLGLSPSS